MTNRDSKAWTEGDSGQCGGRRGRGEAGCRSFSWKHLKFLGHFARGTLWPLMLCRLSTFSPIFSFESFSLVLLFFFCCNEHSAFIMNWHLLDFLSCFICSLLADKKVSVGLYRSEIKVHRIIWFFFLIWCLLSNEWGFFCVETDISFFWSEALVRVTHSVTERDPYWLCCVF